MDNLRNIWVIGGRDGYSIGDESIELVGEAYDICRKARCSVSIVIFGNNLDDPIEALVALGMADRLYAFESHTYGNYDPTAYVSALKELAQEKPPDIILISAASMGRDLAPRLACHLGGSLISNIQQVQLTPKGGVKAVKPVYGRKANAICRFSGNPPYIVTILPGVIGINRKKGAKDTEVIMRPETGMDPVSRREYEVVGFLKADPRTIDIMEADVVVAGGRGVAGAEGFRDLEEFACLIGGTVGCSRPVVDQGILKLDRQIGQTGRTVAPELFISCGISGAMQHEMGMKDSKYIIAINTDEEAPVFKISDYKVVSDVNMLLPELIKLLKARRIELEST